jgi:hypothetical protein
VTEGQDEVDELGGEYGAHKTVFIDRERQARGVNNFLWRNSSDAPPIHRVVDVLIGLLLVAFGLVSLDAAQRGSSTDRIVGRPVSACAFAGAAWAFRNAFKRRNHWHGRS